MYETVFSIQRNSDVTSVSFSRNFFTDDSSPRSLFFPVKTTFVIYFKNLLKPLQGREGVKLNHQLIPVELVTD
jgi:hypothetical protein